MSIGIFGLGTVGNALHHYYSNKNIPIYIYDKYKVEYNTYNTEKIFDCDIIFICIPSNYDTNKKEYDLIEFHKILQNLHIIKYQGAVIIKSTLLPGTSQDFSTKYKLNIIYNPEFLSEKTSIYDYANPKQIILGKTDTCNDDVYNMVVKFNIENFPDISISCVNSQEAESCKLFLNSFYAVKVQFFNELYFISKQFNLDFKKITHLMTMQGWLNPQHTQVPGTDGEFSYGGKCLPKDAISLLELMNKNNTIHGILKATIDENKIFRPENF